MQPKKNPKVDLNRNSGLYFVIGLVLVLFIVWRALEYKTYETIQEFEVSHNVDPDLREEVPITEKLNLPPPPAPPAAPVIIEVVEDAAEIDETVIQSTEISQETEISDIISADDVVVDEVEEEVSVPFAIIEDVPVFPGCEEGSKEEKRACFQQKMQEHIKKNFQYPEIALEMGIQGRVHVQFAIDANGNITGIRSRGPDNLLEKEAERIIGLLPKMKPGRQRGRPVSVPYSIPVNFKML